MRTEQRQMRLSVTRKVLRDRLLVWRKARRNRMHPSVGMKEWTLKFSGKL